MVEEYQRLVRLIKPFHNERPVTLKASAPGLYTMSGCLLPNAEYADRWALTEAQLPIVRAELEALVEAGCREISVDEPSMSCYAYKEDIATRERLCLQHAPADRLVFAPDCGLSQTASWAAKRKMANMCEGIRIVRNGI